MREFGPPAFALGHPAPYPAVQSMFDGLLPHGLYHYWKADFVDDLTEQAIAGHVHYGPRIPTVHSAVHIYPWMERFMTWPRTRRHLLTGT